MQDTKLPPLSTGDWLLWKNMGAYTQAGASRFNGLPFADAAKVYI
jgi:diaminopimelate decarboxylase